MTVPSASRASACQSPAATCVALEMPGTCVGPRRVAMVPSPIWPLSLRPQANTRPSAIAAMENWKPAAMVVPSVAGAGVGAGAGAGDGAGEGAGAGAGAGTGAGAGAGAGEGAGDGAGAGVPSDAGDGAGASAPVSKPVGPSPPPPQADSSMTAANTAPSGGRVRVRAFMMSVSPEGYEGDVEEA